MTKKKNENNFQQSYFKLVTRKNLATIAFFRNIRKIRIKKTAKKRTEKPDFVKKESKKELFSNYTRLPIVIRAFI